MYLDTNLPIASVQYNGVDMDLVSSGKYFWNKHEVLLPDDYTAVEYIESSGTQYIDTGVIPNQDTRVVADLFFPLSTSNAVAFGASNGGTTNYALFATSSGYRIDYASQWDTVLSTSITKRFIADKNKNILTLDGTRYTATYTSFSVGYNMFLFARSQLNAADCFATMKLYSCQIYDYGTLVRNYIPCVNSSGTAGLYDTVNDVFYTNAGSGTFAVGEECTDLIVGDFIGFVDSNSIGAYPNGGIKDGYYYEVTGEELAITENCEYDVRPYAIANVNVAPVLLWTNASPTSNLKRDQTLTFDGEWDGYIVELRGSTSVATTGCGIIFVGQNNAFVGINSDYSKLDPGYAVGRYFKTVSKNSVYVERGTVGTGTNDECGIATRIWGVKFTL